MMSMKIKEIKELFNKIEEEYGELNITGVNFSAASEEKITFICLEDKKMIPINIKELHPKGE